MRRLKILVQFIIVFFFVTGCSISITTLEKPEINVQKPQEARVLVLGEITSGQRDWEQLEPAFRKQFMKYITERKIFDTALDCSVAKCTPLIMVGKVTALDEGNKALRAVVGFGAGKAKLKGQFEIRDTKGATLLRFESQGAEYGGVGVLLGVPGVIGGYSNLEPMINAFAINVAHTVMLWSKGEAIE